jgi:hypothetical protein
VLAQAAAAFGLPASPGRLYIVWAPAQGESDVITTGRLTDRAAPPPPRPSETAGDTILEVLRRLESGPRGLTETEAAARLVTRGENSLPQRRTPSWPRRCAHALRAAPFTAEGGACRGPGLR